MRFAFVSCVMLICSSVYAATPTATTDPSADYLKIDMTRPPPPPSPVYVLNFPEVQAVSGTVSVDNLPAVQTVGGTVNVGNLPLDADGALRVGSPTGRFIGVTAAAVFGSAGWRDLNLVCNSQFGAAYPAVRMCTSRDILKTPVSQWPSLPGNAWVQPVIVSAAVTNSTGGYPYPSGGFVDMSGVVVAVAQDISCNGWSGITLYGASNSGLVLKNNGGFGTVTCTDATTHVTCCADATP